jgi:hypothetical protein
MLVVRRDLSVHASEHHRRACPDACVGDVSQGAQRCSDEPKPAGRHFGLDRRTIRARLRRWKADGGTGLVPRYRARRKRRLPDTTRELIRYRMLRPYPRQNQYASLHFLEELRRQLPFAIRKLQCDNGSEFPLAFKLASDEPRRRTVGSPATGELRVGGNWSRP